MKKELASSFTGKRLAIYGVLLAAIAFLAAGGVLNVGTVGADSHVPASGDDGLFHRDSQGAAIKSATGSVTLTTGYLHEVCVAGLVPDVRTALGLKSSSDDLQAAEIGIVRSLGRPHPIGANWLIQDVLAAKGANITQVQKRHDAANGTYCVFWTSTRAGSQTVLLTKGANVIADRADGTTGDVAADKENYIDMASAEKLTVHWVSDVHISITNALGASVTAAPIPGEVVYVAEKGYANIKDGTDSDSDPDGIGLTINIRSSSNPRVTKPLANVKVSVSTAGSTCGNVDLNGTTVGSTDASPTVYTTGGDGKQLITVHNPGCAMAESSTKVTVKVGDMSRVATVEWKAGGYTGVTTQDHPTDSNKKFVIFHAADRDQYGDGFECGSTTSAAAGRGNSMARSVKIEAVGGGGVATATPADLKAISSIGANGKANPLAKPTLRELPAGQSECQWISTIQSFAALDAALNPTAIVQHTSAKTNEDGFTILDFSSTTVLTLVDGWNLVSWSGPDTAVGDAIANNEGVASVFSWNPGSQQWLSYFPDTNVPGLNTLSELETGSAYWIQVN